jgi:hypothetical protein
VKDSTAQPAEYTSDRYRMVRYLHIIKSRGGRDIDLLSKITVGKSGTKNGRGIAQQHEHVVHHNGAIIGPLIEVGEVEDWGMSRVIKKRRITYSGWCACHSRQSARRTLGQ